MMERYDDAEQIEAARMEAEDYERIRELPNRIGVDMEDLDGALRGLGMTELADRLYAVSELFLPIQNAISDITDPDAEDDPGVWTPQGWVRP